MLEEDGIHVFLDKWHLVPGEPWQEAIEEALDDSSCCAVFLGPDGIGSWENEEMRVLFVKLLELFYTIAILRELCHCEESSTKQSRPHQGIASQSLAMTGYN